MIRLNKFLSHAGVASRRSADILMEQGRVSVNGEVVKHLGVQIDEHKDVVTLDGKRVKIANAPLYLMLNKPVSYLVTCNDNFKRPIVLDLVGEFRDKVRPVGRLDFNSSGLLLLTNDGELAFRLTHPRFHINKTYRVRCEGHLSDGQISKLEKGIELDDGVTAPVQIELVSRAGGFSHFLITMHEGRKRQVRRMCQAAGLPVVALQRVAFGNLKLGHLKEGQFRHLNESELRDLKRSVEL